jgi:hypothetical protein
MLEHLPRHDDKHTRFVSVDALGRMSSEWRGAAAIEQ